MIKTSHNSDSSKSELLNRFSHEIRTPLTSIIGYAEAMLNDPKLAPEAKQEFVEIIRNAGKRLSDFIDTYLDLEAVERNRQLEQELQEDLSFVVQRAAQSVSPIADAKSITIDCRCEAALFVRGVSQDHILRALENVLINAVELAPEGGRIDVRATQTLSSIEIEVVSKDRGFLSLSVNEASKQFRWIQSPGIEIHHDGLGLAFAKHVVELEGGVLNVRGLQQGLTFTLQFPRMINN